jgi:hypothetical protein
MFPSEPSWQGRGRGARDRKRTKVVRSVYLGKTPCHLINLHTASPGIMVDIYYLVVVNILCVLNVLCVRSHSQDTLWDETCFSLYQWAHGSSEKMSDCHQIPGLSIKQRIGSPLGNLGPKSRSPAHTSLPECGAKRGGARKELLARAP